MINKFMQPIYAIIAILAMLFAPMAFAQTSAAKVNSLDVSNLTAEQKAALIANVAALEKEEKSPTNISKTIRTEAEAWGDLGGNMGRAAVSAAREIGMAANDFVQTPLGKVTMGIIVYKIIGAQLLGVVFGSIIMAFFMGLTLYFIIWRNKYDDVEYENIVMLKGWYVRKVVKKAGSMNSEVVIGHWVCAAICVAITVITFAKCILP